MDKITSLAKRRGFVYQGSEIYGGLAGTWDYGPLGVALKNNIKNLWWKKFVDDRTDMFGVDAAILMSAKVWEASGHVAGFSDPMVECGKCKRRFRADHLVESKEDYEEIKSNVRNLSKGFIDSAKGKLNEVKNLVEPIEKSSLSNEEKGKIQDLIKPYIEKSYQEIESNLDEAETILKEVEASNKYLGLVTQIYLNHNILCPEKSCRAHGQWSIPREFNMMFKTQVGAMEDSSSVSYLRPETAQGMFVNFKNVVDSFHPKLPFGLAQIGKAFRNEITPRDFIFRVREFEQMEIEYFVREQDWEKEFEYWKDEMMEWIKDVGIDMNKTHDIEIAPEDRAHYSKRTVDFEFEYPFGQKELFGLAYRTDYDLSKHGLVYVDEETKTKLVPHVIEPSFGLDRALLAILVSAYSEDESGPETRVYLKFKPSVAPVICAVSPLLKNKPELVDKARLVFGQLKSVFGRVMWDDNGNIGKRYRRQDEIGTPYCITIDFDTLTDGTVTVRDRDTGAQERVHEKDLVAYISKQL
ncbi:MAG: glycine--tRNA ligase [Candidatus Pacebacteria bacterium]|nr:glycine--tRNA ligase [Candidatus Paceibacterota bacterium]